MDDLKVPSFFIDLFKKIFGERANLVMCIFMFMLTAPGGELMRQIGIALDSAEGKRLMSETVQVLKEKIERVPNA